MSDFVAESEQSRIFGDFLVAQLVLPAEQDGGALVFGQSGQRLLDFLGEFAVQHFFRRRQSCDLSSYCRCGWSSCSAWVSSMDSAGCRERRRISFRHRLRAMVKSQVENLAVRS